MFPNGTTEGEEPWAKEGLGRDGRHKWTIAQALTNPRDPARRTGLPTHTREKKTAIRPKIERKRASASRGPPKNRLHREPVARKKHP